MNKLLLVTVMMNFLFGCAESNPEKTTDIVKAYPQKKVEYSCNRATTLKVAFAPAHASSAAIAIIKGYHKEAIVLPRKKVASGFWYSNGKYSLRGKGEQATWTVGRMAPFQCIVTSDLPVTQHSK